MPKRLLPLYTVVVLYLRKNRGSSTDIDMLKALRKNDKDLTYSMINKTLFKLEIEGIIHVSTLKKNVKYVELIKNKEM